MPSHPNPSQVRNPVLRDGVLRATLAIAVPDFVLSLSYTLFHFLNLLRGSKTTGVACEFFGVVTSCIVHATFCGPPIVAFSTYVMIRNSASGCTGDPKLSWTANACLVVLPWLLGFGFAMAALREGKLGDYRGLLCYNTHWDSFFTGGVTIAVFATATVATLVLYLAAVATIATTIKTARATYSYKDDTRLWLLLRAGLLLVGSFFASWILFVVAIIVSAATDRARRAATRAHIALCARSTAATALRPPLHCARRCTATHNALTTHPPITPHARRSPPPARSPRSRTR
jgi:hypothetical protein